MYAAASALILIAPFFTANAALVPCGGTGQSRCTLCHLIIGIHGVIKYGYRIALTIAIAMITLGGIMYILSRGDSGAVAKAKAVIYNALIGTIIIFGAWIMVNTTMLLLSAKSNLGVQKATSWDTFKCAP